MILYKIYKFLFSWLYYAIYGVKVYGRENIPKDGPYLMCANHTQILDPFMLALISPKCLHFLAKKEFGKNPIMRWLITRAGAVMVERSHVVPESDPSASSPVRSGTATAIEIIKSGECVALFPEGTRVKSDSQGIKAKAGIAIIAAKTGAKIVPVGIKAPVKAFRRNVLTVGEPIYLDPEKYGNLTHDEYLVISENILNEIKRLRDSKHE